MRVSVLFNTHKEWLVNSETEQNQLAVAAADGLNRRDYGESFIMIDIHSEIRSKRKDALKIKNIEKRERAEILVGWI